MSVLQQWADIVDDVSDPSTEPGPEKVPSERRSLRDDLLDPPNGGYPFIEWEDVSDNEKMVLGLKLMGEAGMVAGITHHTLFTAAQARINVEAVKAPTRPALKDMVARVVAETIDKIEEAKKQASVDPQPARPGHLMAQGSMLRTARQAIRDGNRMARKVSFTEPVNAFTCLHGDSLARGGDMLTAVTICDTTEETYNGVDGRPKTRYIARAVTT